MAGEFVGRQFSFGDQTNVKKVFYDGGRLTCPSCKMKKMKMKDTKGGIRSHGENAGDAYGTGE